MLSAFRCYLGLHIRLGLLPSLRPGIRKFACLQVTIKALTALSDTPPVLRQRSLTPQCKTLRSLRWRQLTKQTPQQVSHAHGVPRVVERGFYAPPHTRGRCSRHRRIQWLRREGKAKEKLFHRTALDRTRNANGHDRAGGFEK